MGCYKLKEKETEALGFNNAVEIKNKKHKIGILGFILHFYCKINVFKLLKYIKEEIGYHFCSFKTTTGYEVHAKGGACTLILDERGAIDYSGCS